jgi:hypothetical protein
MLQKARSAERVSAADIINYRREAELHVGSDDHLYRIEWVRTTRTIICPYLAPGVGSPKPDVWCHTSFFFALAEQTTIHSTHTVTGHRRSIDR